MKNVFLALYGCLLAMAGCAQKENKAASGDIKVGGRCEDCEAIYECPVPFAALNETDTLPDFAEAGPKLFVSGVMYRKDGKTPAADVVMYFYHTDQAGIYPRKGNEKGLDKRHGYLRGWIKTNAKGEYRFYTLVPASYPNSTNPKHIHAIIKEPGKSEYWIDDFLFADDSLLPASARQPSRPVGGNGVLQTVLKDGLLQARRDIILGLHVNGYPQ